jgi:hypothetical protein
MIIGNSTMGATMAQYCLIRKPEDFDLDAGLSYDVFMEMVKSLRFIEE